MDHHGTLVDYKNNGADVMLLINYVQNQFPLVLSPEYMIEKQNKLTQIINHTLQHAPTQLSTQSSEYFSPCYQKKHAEEHEVTLLMTWLAEKTTSSISSLSLDLGSRLSFFGSLPANEQQAQMCYLLHNALHFKATGLGNCNHRASYSAIELAKVFMSMGVDIEVKLRSFPEIDHFVVMIGSHQDGWKIHDPLTNPELIFDEEEYNTRIKPLFKLVNTPKIPYELTISGNELNQYESLNYKMNELLKNKTNQLSINTLKLDNKYLGYLQLKGISDPSFQKTEQALQNLLAITCVDSMSRGYKP